MSRFKKSFFFHYILFWSSCNPVILYLELYSYYLPGTPYLLTYIVKWKLRDSRNNLPSNLTSAQQTPKHQPKHKLEKWFIISVDGVRPSVHTYVCTNQTKPIKELNYFSSYCFGWCLGVDHCTTQVLYAFKI